MNTQEAYNGIKAWFSKSTHNLGWDDNAENCVYRADANTKCAVGCLIPDKLYDKSMDREEDAILVRELLDQYPVLEEYFAGVDLEFLSEAQRAHDDAAFGKTSEASQHFIVRDEEEKKRIFLTALDKLADKFGLKK